MGLVKKRVSDTCGLETEPSSGIMSVKWCSSLSIGVIKQLVKTKGSIRKAFIRVGQGC